MNSLDKVQELVKSNNLSSNNLGITNSDKSWSPSSGEAAKATLSAIVRQYLNPIEITEGIMVFNKIENYLSDVNGNVAVVIGGMGVTANKILKITGVKVRVPKSIKLNRPGFSMVYHEGAGLGALTPIQGQHQVAYWTASLMMASGTNVKVRLSAKFTRQYIEGIIRNTELYQSGEESKAKEAAAVFFARKNKRAVNKLASSLSNIEEDNNEELVFKGTDGSDISPDDLMGFTVRFARENGSFVYRNVGDNDSNWLKAAHNMGYVIVSI